MNTPTFQKEFFKVHEVAEIINLGKSLTYQLVKSGDIPSVKLAGSASLRVSRTALEAWINKQRQAEVK